MSPCMNRKLRKRKGLWAALPSNRACEALEGRRRRRWSSGTSGISTRWWSPTSASYLLTPAGTYWRCASTRRWPPAPRTCCKRLQPAVQPEPGPRRLCLIRARHPGGSVLSAPVLVSQVSEGAGSVFGFYSLSCARRARRRHVAAGGSLACGSLHHHEWGNPPFMERCPDRGRSGSIGRCRGEKSVRRPARQPSVSEPPAQHPRRRAARAVRRRGDQSDRGGSCRVGPKRARVTVRPIGQAAEAEDVVRLDGEEAR